MAQRSRSDRRDSVTTVDAVIEVAFDLERRLVAMSVLAGK
jgi:hypothetical protein